MICATTRAENITHSMIFAFTHQKLVRDYIRMDSPYRGLLLFHGLGVGKTCASIAIAECFRASSRKIVIILNVCIL